MNLINSNRDSHNGCLFLWNKKGRYLAIPLNEHRGGVEFDCVTGVPSANGEFVSIRRFPLISPVILYNKECFQNNS
ncbi:hypothetical protein C9764_15520, partial (plasmid) [Listeria monocytogenes]